MNDIEKLQSAEAEVCRLENITKIQQAQIERLLEARNAEGLLKVKAEAERDAALAKCLEEKKWSEDFAKQICEMEDALGFRYDQHDVSGAFIPTLGPWKDRVRDLIAKEGELGDALAACAEMRHVLEENLQCLVGDYGCPACKRRTEDILKSTDLKALSNKLKEGK